MGRIGNLMNRVESFRAKSRGLSVEEYRSHRKQLHETETKERLEFDKWKLHEKYQQKRKRVHSAGGKLGGSGVLGQILDLGTNVNKNLERESRSSGGSLSAFFSEPSPRKRRRNKKR